MSKKNLLYLAVILQLSCAFVSKAQDDKDVFQKIAKQKGGEVPGLAPNLPPVLPAIVFPVDKVPRQNFSPSNKMDTQEELETELAAMEKKYAPFMSNLAPPVENRKSIELIDFNWRIAEYYELQNDRFALEGLGRWTKVKVPHYAGPIGKAVSFYRAEFNVSDSLFQAEALFLRFQGVDYYASVFVNGKAIGSHEGMSDAFEFNIKSLVKKGKNSLLVRAANDGSPIGTTPPYQSGKNFIFGTKLAASGGPGWNDPYLGWNCTPVGFGLWQRVWLEARSNSFVNAIFVRPDIAKKKAEVWLELGFAAQEENVQLSYSLFGQNFNAAVISNAAVPREFQSGSVPQFLSPPRDTLCKTPLIRMVKFSFAIPQKHWRLWTPQEPWLYQLQVKVRRGGKAIDEKQQQAGMRSFVQSEVSTPKGRFYLNGKEIRLRGANTMGNLMQCVMRRDFKQLTRDILLAKIAHNNFWRMTQQPCQSEVYDYFDKLGMMAQSDMPAFCYIPTEKRNEFLRQAGALFRMVRSHPSNIMVSYINEPYTGTRDNIPRLSAAQEVRLFRACDSLIVHVNPEQVTKWADGDYQNLNEKYSDHHCYNLWYWKHALPFSQMYKGHWTDTRQGWMHGCGEYGAEGIDDVYLMKKYYPGEWLEENNGKWTPEKIPGCQTSRADFKRWIGTPVTMEEWADSSRKHQQYATRLTVEALRRDAKMNSTAIHLLIDAWPDGWMKAVTDYDRRAKPAYFELRDAQSPVAANLRPEKFFCFAGDTVKIEAWNANDLEAFKGISQFYAEQKGNIIASGTMPATILSCAPAYQGKIQFVAPEATSKEMLKVYYAVSEKGKTLHHTVVEIEVYPKTDKGKKLKNPGGKWQFLIES